MGKRSRQRYLSACANEDRKSLASVGPDSEIGPRAHVDRLYRLRRIFPALFLAAYALLLWYQHDETPPGLHNDTAEEALRAILLLDQHKFQPIAVGVIGTSTE